MSKDQQHCCAARLAAGMPIDRCGCQEWVNVIKGVGGRPACCIPMTVKDAAGRVVPGQVPPPPSLRSAVSKFHRCTICQLDALQQQLDEARRGVSEGTDDGVRLWVRYQVSKLCQWLRL